MTLRLKDGARYFLAYDAESRLTPISGMVSEHAYEYHTPQNKTMQLSVLSGFGFCGR
jgi:hypothetical protein